MQYPRLIFVNLDPRGQQIFVIAPAGAADRKVIIARGKDNRRVDTAVGRRTDGALQGVYRDIVSVVINSSRRALYISVSKVSGTAE